MPRDLTSFTSSQLAAAQLINSTKKVNSNMLISLISKGYDHQLRQTERFHMTKGGRKSRANQDKVSAVIGAKDRKPRDTC